jgi:hypothetical protein
MDGNNDDVAGLAMRGDLSGECFGSSRGEMGQDVHSRPIGPRAPLQRGSAGGRGERKHEQACPARSAEDCRGACVGLITSGTRRADACPFDRFDCFYEAARSKILNMVVGKDAAIDTRCREASDVARVHAVVDAFCDVVITRRDAGFEIDEANVRCMAAQIIERIAPDVGYVARPRDRTVGALGKGDVVEGRFDKGLVQPRIGRVGEDLVDTPSGHNVSAQEDSDRVDHALLAESVARQASRLIGDPSGPFAGR